MDPTLMRQAIRASGAGLQFAATIGFFLWIGGRVDAAVSTAPWGSLLGGLVGLLGGMWMLLRMFNRDADDDSGASNRP